MSAEEFGLRAALNGMHLLFWTYVILTMDHPGNPFTRFGAWRNTQEDRRTERMVWRAVGVAMARAA